MSRRFTHYAILTAMLLGYTGLMILTASFYPTLALCLNGFVTGFGLRKIVERIYPETDEEETES